MLYPTNIEKKIGFEHIREWLDERCLSALGRRYVQRMCFVIAYDQLNTLLMQTDEMKTILSVGEAFPTAHFLDASSSLEKSTIEGTFLSERELLDISLSLQTAGDCVQFLRSNNEYPYLQLLTTHVSISEKLIGRISEVLDENAQVKDNASADLATIRKEMSKAHRQVRILLDSIYKTTKSKGYVPDGTSLTVRGGRMVIPINVEHKRKVKGFIHGESATGRTVFIEPTQVLEGNNRIQELEYAERREVIKLLTLLTDLVRSKLTDLERVYQFLGVIDFIRAKARLAIDLNANKPLLSEVPIADWQNAHHPLLYMSYQSLDKKVVPLQIRLVEQCRVLLISGPNAGGKSVCLKTVGLLQYMLQCGLLIPIDSDSQAGIFSDIFIDIGDEQSIENDLSTYSSHLTNMKALLKNSRDTSLVLIDEFGTGTEPKYGGAIAEAILKRIVELGTYGVITTHYDNLKHFAEQHEGIQNGAMRFDIEKLQPFYILEMGKPGSSYALEISQKIGLPRTILDYAKEIIGQKQVAMDKLLSELQRDKIRANNREKSLIEKEKQLRKELDKYHLLYEEIKSKKKEIINKAKTEASQMLTDTNKEIEKTIRHIKENKAEKKETQKVRNKLSTLKRKVEHKKGEEAATPNIKIIEGAIGKGDCVRIKGHSVVGQVVGEKGKDVEVLFGELKSNVKRQKLEKVQYNFLKDTKKSTWQGRENQQQTTGKLSLHQKKAKFSHKLDVRGKRAEEIIPTVQRYIDEATMVNANEVKILHGTGNGVLRQIIRQYLSEEPQVATFADEHVEQGGAGITVITMK